MGEPEISRILESYFQSGSLQRRNTLYQNNWSAGCEAYVNHDYQRAVEEFKNGDHSKMMYNLGMSYLALNAIEPAKEAFSKALSKDRFFALGWFQRGLGGDYASAFQDYIMAKKLLHENIFIDYAKIGCKFDLKKSEIFYNLALVHIQLGNLDEANKAISEGKSIADRTTAKSVDFDSLRTAKGPSTPIYSKSEIFHPPILASAAKQRTNTNPEKMAIKDDLADSIRGKIRKLDEVDQAQIFQVLTALKKNCGEEVTTIKNVPEITGREEILVRQLLELRDIVFNKNVSKTLIRHARELAKSDDKRAEKWKIWCDLFTEHNANGNENIFVAQFLKSEVAKTALLSICRNTPSEDEDLLLLQIFSFLLLPTIKPDHVLEFAKNLSSCANKNHELTKLVVNSILHLENSAPTANTETEAIFPSFFASLEIFESAQNCKKFKTSSTVLETMKNSVTNLVEKYSEEFNKSDKDFKEQKQVATDKINKLDSEIEALRSSLTHQGIEIQATASTLGAKKVQKKAKVDKLGLVREDKVNYLKIRAEEEKKIAQHYDLTKLKIEAFKKSVNSLKSLDTHLRAVLSKLVQKFIPTLLQLITSQENNIKYLETKFANYKSSMLEFRGEREIYAKLRAAFRVVAGHFRVLAHNTQVLAQSTQTLTQVLSVHAGNDNGTQEAHNNAEQDNGAHDNDTQAQVHAQDHASVFDAHEWDAVRSQVSEACGRVSRLLEKQEDMEAKFSISKDGEQDK